MGKSAVLHCRRDWMIVGQRPLLSMLIRGIGNAALFLKVAFWLVRKNDFLT